MNKTRTMASRGSDFEKFKNRKHWDKISKEKA
jgi:hypothetical protein